MLLTYCDSRSLCCISYTCQFSFLFFFFFQAEDGIRDVAVTGVQTCALPISSPASRWSWNRTGSSRCSWLRRPSWRRPSVRAVRLRGSIRRSWSWCLSLVDRWSGTGGGIDGVAGRGSTAHRRRGHLTVWKPARPVAGHQNRTVGGPDCNVTNRDTP